MSLLRQLDRSRMYALEDGRVHGKQTVRQMSRLHTTRLWTALSGAGGGQLYLR
jgi:hypothetical protein